MCGDRESEAAWSSSHRRVLSAMMLLGLVLLAPALFSSAAVPHGLQVDWQNCPALGVSRSPVFGWIVPSCTASADAVQTAYRLRVLGDSVEWDSGTISSNSSVAVRYGGPALAAGAAYRWTVQTTTSCSPAASGTVSAEGTFITALGAEDWDASASWIGLGKNESTFNLVRRVVHVPPSAEIQRVVAFVSAQNSWSGMLMNYKLWVDGTLVSVGPGRGEAPIAGGDGTFKAQPYNTIDLTAFLPARGGPTVLALQTMQFSGFNPNTGSFPFPCAPDMQCNGPTQISRGPAVLMQLDIHHLRGTQNKSTVVTQANSGWKVLDGDHWLRPQIREKVCFGPGCGAGSGTGRVEHTDARNEPLGWRDNPRFDDSAWAPAVEISTPSLIKSELIPRMAGPAVEITETVNPVRTTAVAGPNRTHFVDFGAEFSGGIRLTVKDGRAGQIVRFKSGELCTPLVYDGAAFDGIGQNVSDSCTSVDQSWGWSWNYTLRDGEQTIEQHQYLL